MLRRLAGPLLALALIVPSGALADGDPASDVLPSQDAFYPYTPQASKPLVAALDKLLAQVRKSGYPMKVALIASAADLGSFPTMYNNPQRYADLLSSELPDNPHGGVKDELHLLVVMAGGFGGKNLGDGVDAALAPVEIDPGTASDGLVRAAMQAVARIATANGHETAVPPEARAGGDDGGGVSAVLLVAIGAAVLLLAALALLLRRRRAASDDRPPAGEEPQANGQDTRST